MITSANLYGASHESLKRAREPQDFYYWRMGKPDAFDYIDTNTDTLPQLLETPVDLGHLDLKYHDSSTFELGDEVCLHPGFSSLATPPQESIDFKVYNDLAVDDYWSQDKSHFELDPVIWLDPAVNAPASPPEVQHANSVNVEQNPTSNYLSTNHSSSNTSSSSTYPSFFVITYPNTSAARKYRIRCNIDDINTNELTTTFRQENCIYPKATLPPQQYKGKRQNFEKMYNELGWRLASLNPEIRKKKGLIQYAVDNYRNRPGCESMWSRRARRTLKKNKMST